MHQRPSSRARSYGRAFKVDNWRYLTTGDTLQLEGITKSAIPAWGITGNLWPPVLPKLLVTKKHDITLCNNVLNVPGGFT